MSVVPLQFSNWWEDLNRPHRLFDQDFGLGFYPDPLLIPFEQHVHHPSNYYRTWGQQFCENNVGTSTINSDKDKFQVILDVQQFKPEEINVKVVDKNVVVEGKHEEKKNEHGYISRHFVRKYLIPDQCNLSQVSSSLSSDGVLSITALRKDVPMAENERKIEIKYVNKPVIAKTSKDQGDKNID